MLEQSLRELFEQQAEAEAPPGRITVADVLRQGRLRRRWHRIGAVGAPVFAAAAVSAIAIGSIGLPAGSHSGGHEQEPRTATTRRFSALAPYATFGWLPAKEPVFPGHQRALAGLNTNGSINAVSENLSSGPWTLDVYAIGACHQVGNQVDCGKNQPDPCTFTREVPAPPVNGHQAFWPDPGKVPYAGFRCLNWEYAPGGWASLWNFNEIHPDKQLDLRVASAIRFGKQPWFKFAAQLRKLPGKWRVVRAGFVKTDGALLAGDYTIRDGATSIDVNISPANAKPNQCERYDTLQRPGAAVRGCRVINGYYVNSMKPPAPTTPSCHRGSACAALVNYAQISASDADGWNVSLMASPRFFGLLFKVFAHMTVLGRNPAAWTTKPIS